MTKLKYQIRDYSDEARPWLHLAAFAALTFAVGFFLGAGCAAP